MILEPKELQKFIQGLTLQMPPKTEIKVDEPDTEEGVWFVDVRGIVVQYQTSKGFGLFFSNSSGYGVKPDVVCESHLDAEDVIRQNVYMNLLG